MTPWFGVQWFTIIAIMTKLQFSGKYTIYCKHFYYLSQRSLKHSFLMVLNLSESYKQKSRLGADWAECQTVRITWERRTSHHELGGGRRERGEGHRQSERERERERACWAGWRLNGPKPKLRLHRRTDFSSQLSPGTVPLLYECLNFLYGNVWPFVILNAWLLISVSNPMTCENLQLDGVELFFIKDASLN